MAILKESNILLNQEFTSKYDAIRVAGQLLVDNGYVEKEYIEKMIEREDMLSVYIGNFIAIPHGTEDAKKFVNKSGISVIQVPNGVNFDGSSDDKLVTMVFGIAGIGNEHLDILSKIAIYCSEIVWKAYQHALGIQLAPLQKLQDFDLSDVKVKALMQQRYGKHIPLQETVIAPQAIFASKQLRVVK